MKILDELARLQASALADNRIKEAILATRSKGDPLGAFCAFARSEGYEIYEMDLIQAGEETYAGMRRATNGGGENSPLLEYEDDYYSLFMAALE